MPDFDPLSDASDPQGPWYRRTSVGLVIIVLCLGAAGVVQINKYQAAAEPPGRTDPSASPHPLNNPKYLDETFDLAGLTIDRDSIHRGGPSIDGIPSLTTQAARQGPVGIGQFRYDTDPPTIVPAAHADFLPDDSRVVGVTLAGRSRAYPIAVLNYHECINDILAGVPIAIIYCPLCDSVTVLDRRVGEGDDQRVLEFGISGVLYNSNVLLYDRNERGLWSQIKLQAVSGPRAGTALRHLGGWTLSTAGKWRTEHPLGDVLSYETDYQRRYGADPYADRHASDHISFPIEREDDALPVKQRIIGVVYKGDAVALVLGPGIEPIDHEFADGQRLLIHRDAAGGITIVHTPGDARIIHTYWYAWAATHPHTTIVR